MIVLHKYLKVKYNAVVNAGIIVRISAVQHSVREFTELAFHYAGIELAWSGSGINEKGTDTKTGRVVVEVSEAFYRPTDVVSLLGDPAKARKKLGWNPARTSFEELVHIMVDHDMKKAAMESGRFE